MYTVIRWTHINSELPRTTFTTDISCGPRVAADRSFAPGSRTPHRPGDTAATAAWSRAALHGFLRILVGCLFGEHAPAIIIAGALASRPCSIKAHV